MKGKRKTSYPLAIILSTISTVLPFAGFTYFIYDLLTSINKEIGVLPVIVFLTTFAQWVFLKYPLKKMYQQAILDNEYDEFGNSKKHKFENLTRAQREEMDLQKTAQMESLLSSSAVKKIVHKGSTNPEKDLNSLIGLQSVKTKISEMAARMKFEKESSKKENFSQYGMNGRHFVFYGSAGTGKTTVARIITGFLYKYGYIRENKCVEVDGSFLKAAEMTDVKTKLVLQRAYGGVLFIDEAYALMNGNYGDTAIATLIKEMEDNRDKFTVILAGYKNDMKNLLERNEGFKSRVKEYLEFPDYNIEEMKQIFVAMAHEQGFVVSADALSNFEIRCAKEIKLSSFGNGRTVRNILDETIDRHAVNFGKGLLGDINKKNEDNKFVLCGVDVSTSVNRNNL